MAAILGLSASLACLVFLPVRGANRERKNPSCLANLKNLGLAAVLYASDDDGTLPGNAPSTVDNSPGVGLSRGFADPKAPRNWAMQLYPYSNTTAIYRCPTESPSADEDWSALPGVAEIGYLLNGIPSNRPIVVIPAPSRTILFQEEQTYLRVAEERPSRICDEVDHTQTDVATRFDSSRWSNNHERGGNLVFCDGHVEYRLKSTIGFVDFGATNGHDAGSLCSDGSVAREDHMTPADTSTPSREVDERQHIACPTAF